MCWCCESSHVRSEHITVVFMEACWLKQRGRVSCCHTHWQYPIPWTVSAFRAANWTAVYTINLHHKEVSAPPFSSFQCDTEDECTAGLRQHPLCAGDRLGLECVTDFPFFGVMSVEAKSEKKVFSIVATSVHLRCWYFARIFWLWETFMLTHTRTHS